MQLNQQVHAILSFSSLLSNFLLLTCSLKLLTTASYTTNAFGVIWSSLTGNQYWLAQDLTALTHPTYQRLSLKRPFRGIQFPARSHLEGGFPLRCFQRLSLPNVATGQCHWRDNPNTRGSFTPVLSYQEQLFSNLKRPRQIGTELSHDVLNPARVPL